MAKRRFGKKLTNQFEELATPVFVVNELRCLVYANPAVTDWLGIANDKLVGERCDYHSGDGSGSVADALSAICPPPSVFSGQVVESAIVWRDSDQQVARFAARFIPLSLSSSDPCGAIGFVGDRLAEAPAVMAATEAAGEELHLRLREMMAKSRARFRLDRLVGTSPSIRRIRAQVELAASGSANVVVVGPRGSGREHIARTIHQARQLSQVATILPVDCELMEAEPLVAQLSAFEHRCHDDGTATRASILLKNVDQLAEGAQAEVLAWMKARREPMPVLATSSRSLLSRVRDESFAHELAMSLTTLEIVVPPLSERREDIPLLVQQFVEDQNATGGRQLAGLAPAALDRLIGLPWPQNVEELEQVVTAACQNVEGVWVGVDDFPDRVSIVTSAVIHARTEEKPLRLDEFLLEVETEMLKRALNRAKGNKAKASRLLGISRARLIRRVEQLQLESPDFTEVSE